MIKQCLCPNCRRPMVKCSYGAFYCEHCKQFYSAVPLVGGWRLVPISEGDILTGAN